MAASDVTQITVNNRKVGIIGAELNLVADAKDISVIRGIMQYNVIGSPALIIKGKARRVGSVPSRDQIKRWLRESTDQ